MACFIYGCNSIVKSNYAEGTPNSPYSERSFNDSNHTTTLEYKNPNLHTAIVEQNVSAIKKCFLAPDSIPELEPSILYTNLISMLEMLETQDNNGNTPFHLLSVPNKGYKKLFKWIIKYLKYLDSYVVSKNKKDIKDGVPRRPPF
ncbi:hypothetical protein [Cardinium endosymbiont of Sogatella furcifera]|uniref:hypothetical protein n=1 Tax=Cardinium endosymbiont of Sogatella furcifera TaxID=650378 RepID=UPI0013B3CBB3|nr:hypothetical protein [Cardinium endosymbiont of Sogatella furcifera]